MNIKKIATLMVIIFPLTACSMDSMPWTKEQVGTGVGAIAGGVLGSKVGGGSGQLWATGAGTLIGAFIGSSIGKSLDRADMMYHQQAVVEAQTAPINQTIRWHNNDSGHSGSVTPIREGSYAATGNICREYKQEIFIGGQNETAKGTACQNADGSWTIVQ